MNSIEEIIVALRNQEMVVIMDDEDRENEGDLVKIAEYITADDVNFMAQHARGLICLTLTESHCARLKLPLMTQSNNATLQTNFTVSIEAVEGVTTGISAADRAHTIRTAVASNNTDADICSPGHVFPLRAASGGVLSRAGHTEAGCDLARLAGSSPASVIVEILNEDGSMARQADLERFAYEHKLKIGTINDLIAYRFQRETTIQHTNTQTFYTKYGEFKAVIYKDMLHNNQHVALIKGQIDPKDTIVRVQGRLDVSDILPLAQQKRWSLSNALRYIEKHKSGVLVLIDQEPLSAAALVTNALKRELNATPKQTVWRNSGIGSQILKNLGVQKMRILGEPLRYNALSGFGLDIVESISFSENLLD